MLSGKLDHGTRTFMSSWVKALLALGTLGLLCAACGRPSAGRDEVRSAAAGSGEPRSQAAPAVGGSGLVDPSGMTIGRRFRTPEGYVRTVEAPGSFGAYLRDLPLKPHGAEVRLYDGRTKAGSDVYEAVVDLDIGRRDLHQCADAVIRLRAEYLYARGEPGRIHFNFTNGFRADYAEWARGKRVVVSGDTARWEMRAAPSDSPRDLWNYLETVFAYAGTWSLARELRPVPAADVRPGDVFIVGGSPGHAVIVVDLAVGGGRGEKLFLLAQSYMPAQEIHVLKNPLDGAIGPWYRVPAETLVTPQWTFESTDLKRFDDR
jgi:hypothetical protein